MRNKIGKLLLVIGWVMIGFLIIKMAIIILATLKSLGLPIEIPIGFFGISLIIIGTDLVGVE